MNANTLFINHPVNFIYVIIVFPDKYHMDYYLYTRQGSESKYSNERLTHGGNIMSAIGR